MKYRDFSGIVFFKISHHQIISVIIEKKNLKFSGNLVLATLSPIEIKFY